MSARVVAALRASSRVRDGYWIKGAPSHVLAEFLSELEADGWVLTRTAFDEAERSQLRGALRFEVEEHLHDHCGDDCPAKSALAKLEAEAS